uniref:Peptidase S54 rhomboid domain-containing protein n=1 Tax=Lactuca sativa TaxID=4236 RepID=A0A9R1VDV9_LACSA|nr:hypothetical protein LSAT_V11C500266800 [Lactuca sativa]
MVGSFAHQPSDFSISGLGASPKPFHLITNAAALRLGRFLRHSFLNGVSPGRSHQLQWFKLPQWPHDAVSSCLLFFSGEGNQTNFGDQEKAYLTTPTRGPVNRRRLTDTLLAINVVYIAQVASKGQLLMWGAKINGLIDKGQLWRLVTSAFLHANLGHLMINCYSLNSIGPTMELLSGPKRYLTIYLASAISSSTTSYWLNKSPAVGASGAIFGLVGSFAIFVLRHNKIVKGGVGDLKYVARVIALNMLGGLIGGVAISWLIGPAWRFESSSHHGRRVLVDRAPIFSLPGTKQASQ